MINKKLLLKHDIKPIKFEAEYRDNVSCNFYIIYYTDDIHFYISENSDTEYYLTIYRRTLKTFLTTDYDSLDKVIKTIKDEIQISK